VPPNHIVARGVVAIQFRAQARVHAFCGLNGKHILKVLSISWKRARRRSLTGEALLCSQQTSTSRNKMTRSAQMMCFLAALMSSLSLSPLPAGAFLLQLQGPQGQLAHRAMLCVHGGAQRRQKVACPLAARLAARRSSICQVNNSFLALATT
jgi:hypothetical protein